MKNISDIVVKDPQGKMILMPEPLINLFFEKHKSLYYKKRCYVFFEEKLVWEEVDESELMRLVTEPIQEIIALVWTVNIKNRVLEILKLKIPKLEDIQEMVLEHNIIALENCYYDLDKFQCIAPNSKFFIREKFPIQYDVNAKAIRFRKFLKEVALDKISRIRTMEEVLGASLSNNQESATCLYAFGGGANGKSCFTEIVAGFVGHSNFSAITPVDLETNSFRRGSLERKKVILVDDLEKSDCDKLMKANFRKLVTGGIIDGEVKYGKHFSFQSKAVVIVSANYLPKMKGATTGERRRFSILNFEHYVLPQDRNLTLASDIIRDEISGIFNIAVLGLKRLRANKGTFSCQKESNRILEKIIIEQEPLQYFVETKIKMCNGEFVSYKELAREYKEFCVHKKIGDTVCNSREISALILEQFQSAERHKSGGERGIRNIVVAK